MSLLFLDCLYCCIFSSYLRPTIIQSLRGKYYVTRKGASQNDIKGSSYHPAELESVVNGDSSIPEMVNKQICGLFADISQKGYLLRSNLRSLLTKPGSAGGSPASKGSGRFCRQKAGEPPALPELLR
jgi:hypothetical protein